MTPRPSSSLLALAGIALGACGHDAPRIHRFAGSTMGSFYEVKYTGDVPLATVRGAVEEVLAAHDLAFSKWRTDSEISRLNAAPAADPFAVSERFAAVLALALSIADDTGGAFDPTVGPLLAVYRHAKEDPEHRLDPVALDAARARVDYRKVAVRGGEVHRTGEGIEIDLDGIVAGACIDELAERLDALGVPAFYLEVTSEVFCRGEKAPGVPWRIGVVDPRSGLLDQAPVAALPLRDRALCTSGDYRNAFEADGRRVHHVFDPRTGRSTDHGVVSATVLAGSAAVADALGTAFLVLGVEETRRVAAGLEGRGEIGALLLVADGRGGLRKVEIGWPAGG